MSATIVTCYYRLNSKHSQSDYDKWIANFMSLDANVVIFGDSDSVPFLKRTYPETEKRKYINREFSEFQNAKYDWDKEMGRIKDFHPGHSPKLFMLWNEKVNFVNSVIQANPYNSTKFVWMDIGCIRTDSILPFMKGFPDPTKINESQIHFLQMGDWKADDVEKAIAITPNQFKQRCTLGGTMFAGTIDAHQQFRNLYLSVLDMADKKEVYKGEDQDLYAICALRAPQLFKLYAPLKNGYDEWFSLHLYWSSALRIDIVGPGIMPIPPKGWGAVEILIWDIAQNLRAAGHIVTIHNTKDLSVVYDTIRKTNPDFVHIQYDDYAYLADLIAPYTRAVAITSHYGYLEQPHRWGGYKSNFDCIRAQKAENVYHFVLSEGIKQIYKLFDVQEDHLYVTPNGADESLFRYAPSPAHPDRSIVVGKMEVRKGQWRLMNVDNVWFAGNKSDGSFDYRHPRWLGEWDKPTLYNNLTDYANLVLLSDGEADPLVVKEALIAGLGIVVSTFAAANLDTTLPFITVIPNDKLDDIAYINAAISKNRSISTRMRSAIKEYSKSHTWGARVNDYVSKIQQILNRKPLKLSLCIPTINRWDFLKENLPKYLKFDFIDEIIVTDENGKDAEKIKQHFPNEKLKVYVNSECLGAFKNKEKAVQYARNQWVCLMDSDNFAPLSYFEAFFSYVKNKPDPNVIYCPGKWLPMPGKMCLDFTAYTNIPIDLTNAREAFSSVESLFNDGNYIFDRDTYLRASVPPQLKHCEKECKAADVIFKNYLMLSMSNVKLLIVPHMAYYHDVHPDSYWSTTSSTFDYDFYKSLYFSKLPTLPFRQIILWGFSENTINKTLYSFARNYSDSNYPVDNDWANCLFIVNGDAAKVPIEPSSTYVIYKPSSHHPYVYSCARYIEVQCLEGLINDTNVFNISQDILYEVKKEPNYEVVYIYKIADLSIDALSTILSMKTAPIIVTALFDIQREVIDGRSIDDYKKWTLKTLSQIKDPVVIYLDKKIQMRTEILNARRNVGPVKIIYQMLEELDMYKYKETVTNILQSPFFKIIQKYPKDITNLLPSYTLIQHNKFFFISNALEFTHSDTFLWMDAGFSRFMKDKIYKFNFENPTKFMISCEMKNAHLLSDITFDNYIGTNTRILAGGLFICPRNYVNTIKEHVLDIWEKEMIHKNRIDNEQITLGLVCKTHRQQFELYESIFDVCFS